MEPRDVNDADCDGLSRLLQLERDDESLWDASDLQAILRHQLDAEIEFDLTEFGGVAKETMASLAVAGGEAAARTFGQVLTGADPSLELLDMIRRFAKRCRTHGSDGIPEEVATVLYYAAIAAAKLRCRASISQLDDETLLFGLDWGLAQPWIAAPLKDLFAETIDTIRSRRSEADV